MNQPAWLPLICLSGPVLKSVFRRVRDEIKDRLLAFLVLTTSNSD